MAQIFVFALAPDMMVGVSSDWDESGKPFIAERYLSLPVLGQLYCGKSEMNLKSLLAAAPQVVIDVGESKEGVAADMDELSEKTGIPFVHIDADITTYDEAYTMLGELLGMEDEAEVLSEYCAGTY